LNLAEQHYLSVGGEGGMGKYYKCWFCSHKSEVLFEKRRYLCVRLSQTIYWL